LPNRGSRGRDPRGGGGDLDVEVVLVGRELGLRGVVLVEGCEVLGADRDVLRIRLEIHDADHRRRASENGIEVLFHLHVLADAHVGLRAVGLRRLRDPLGAAQQPPRPVLERHDEALGECGVGVGRVAAATQEALPLAVLGELLHREAGAARVEAVTSQFVEEP
jgi:hypothetical protein